MARTKTELKKGKYQSVICVAGSRSFKDYDLFKKVIAEYLAKEHKGNYIAFVSGAATKGADSMIIEWCSDTIFDCFLFPANWNENGKKAGILRNTEMSKEITHLLAFWDEKSRGTKHMLDTCTKIGVKVHVVKTT